MFGRHQKQAAEALGREAGRYLGLVALLREERGDEWLPTTQPEWLERAAAEAAHAEA